MESPAGNSASLHDVEVDLGGKRISVDASAKDFIGNCWWYSLTHFEAEKEVLEDICVRAGLDFQKLFFEIIRADVYAKVSSKLAFVSQDEAGGIHSYLVRAVDPDSKRNSGKRRWVTHEFKESVDSKPTYEVLGNWYYDDNRLTTTDLMGDENFKRMTEQLEADIERYSKVYTEGHLRNAIMRLFHEVEAIPMRSSGGVYFSPITHQDILEQFALLFKLLNEEVLEERGLEMYLLPVVDNDAQRDYLYVKFEEHAVKETDALIEDMKRRIGEGKPIQQRTWDTLWEKANKLKKLKNSYQENLEIEFETAEFKLEAVESQLKALAGKIKVVS